jgi:Ni,Fe-hydrogenase maturation factor
LPEELGESFTPTGGELELSFALQLAPEMAETIAGYERVVFIDAHTGAVPQDINIRELIPWFQTSPLTHHLTPESCLELADRLYGSKPQAWLVSVRGYEFGFSHKLSTTTQVLVRQAALIVLKWLQGGEFKAE